MPRIAQETIDEVLQVANVYDVIASCLPLKKSGSGYKGLCPFHKEKTPSFHVNPAMQIYKCFGCQKAGNVVSFIMDFDKVDYPEAISLLADRYNIPIRYSGSDGGVDRVQLYRMQEFAADYFKRLLKNAPEAEKARAYLKTRGVSDETADLFGLGYAAPDWDGLLARLRKGGYSDAAIRQSGLVVERDAGGIYDRFRDRLMFPIHDGRGRVIAFGGRALSDSEKAGAKYVNSSETPIFKKSRGLYALHLAGKAQDAETTGAPETLYIVEGYFDVILPYQAGFRGFLAPLGTAFGADHVALVRRHAQRVVLLFDADAAGRKASERSMDVLLGEDLDIFVATLPTGKDPADCIMTSGPEALRESLEKAVEMFDFLIARAVERPEAATTAGKSRIARDLTDRVSALEDPIRRDLLLQKVSKALSIDIGALRSNVRPRAAEAAVAPAVDPVRRQNARQWIELMLLDPTFVPRVRENPGAARIPDPVGRSLAEAIFAQVDAEGRLDAAALQKRLPDAAAVAWLADILSGAQPAQDFERLYRSLLERVEQFETGYVQSDARTREAKKREIEKLRGSVT